jgi:hypothetical protein
VLSQIAAITMASSTRTVPMTAKGRAWRTKTKTLIAAPPLKAISLMLGYNENQEDECHEHERYHVTICIANPDRAKASNQKNAAPE